MVMKLRNLSDKISSDWVDNVHKWHSWLCGATANITNVGVTCNKNDFNGTNTYKYTTMRESNCFLANIEHLLHYDFKIVN